MEEEVKEVSEETEETEEIQDTFNNDSLDVIVEDGTVENAEEVE